MEYQVEELLEFAKLLKRKVRVVFDTLSELLLFVHLRHASNRYQRTLQDRHQCLQTVPNATAPLVLQGRMFASQSKTPGLKSELHPLKIDATLVGGASQGSHAVAKGLDILCWPLESGPSIYKCASQRSGSYNYSLAPILDHDSHGAPALPVTPRRKASLSPNVCCGPAYLGHGGRASNEVVDRPV